MDISSIVPANRTIEIRDPRSNEPVGIRVELRPMSDPEVEKVRRRNLNQRLASRNQKITAEQVEANGMDLIIAAVAGWDWYEADLRGEKPEFSTDNVRKILRELRWMRDQIDAELGDDAAFFQG